MSKTKERRPDLNEIVVTTGQRFKVKEDLRTLTKDINNAKSNSYGLIKITTDEYTPNALLSCPPKIEEQVALTKLNIPPPTNP